MVIIEFEGPLLKEPTKYLLFFFLFFSLGLSKEKPSKILSQKNISLSEWVKKALSFPTNRAVFYGRAPFSFGLGGDGGKIFHKMDDALSPVLEFMRSQLAQKSLWAPKKESWFPNERIFQPFSEKLILTEKSHVFLFGDFHGDIRTFAKELEKLKADGVLDDDFKLRSKDHYMVFLGDYTDRGNYGLEVLYTILRLKMANPFQVFPVRGNHEDWELNARDGFVKEIQRKIPWYYFPTLKLKIENFYNLMPVVIYFGYDDNFIQACHGALETGYKPELLLSNKTGARFDLINPLDRGYFVREFKKNYPGFTSKIQSFSILSNDPLASLGKVKFLSPCFPATLGFMWHDFIFNPFNFLEINPNRGYVYGKDFTRLSLPLFSKKLKAVVRAHQHGGNPSPIRVKLKKNNGIFRFWKNDKSDQSTLPVEEGDVFMFNVGADSLYWWDSYHTSAYGELSTGKTLRNWSMKIHNIHI